MHAALTTETVKYETRDRVAYITLNRPDKLNAISDQLHQELKAAFLYFDTDPNAHVAILHGAGRAFSSGADVRQRQLRPLEELESFGLQSPETRRRDLFYDLVNWKPIIAAAHGYAYGAGLGLAIRCDILVAAASTKFQITEVPRGISGTGLWAMLHFRGGGGFADEVAVTGRTFTAEEAAAHGIVTEVTADGEHLSTAERYARDILKNPPLAVQAIVRARRWQMEKLERETFVLSEPRPALHLTRDFAEAARAWAEKREPRAFEGR